MIRELTYTIAEEQGAYVAQCLELDVASDGVTEAAAVLALQEALALRLECDGAELRLERVDPAAGVDAMRAFMHAAQAAPGVDLRELRKLRDEGRD